MDQSPQNACYGKDALTEDAARRRARGLRGTKGAKGRSRINARFQAYACPYADFKHWHVGHISVTRLNRRRAAILTLRKETNL